jgi:hypothetical protein
MIITLADVGCAIASFTYNDVLSTVNLVLTRAPNDGN